MPFVFLRKRFLISKKNNFLKKQLQLGIFKLEHANRIVIIKKEGDKNWQVHI